MKYLLFLLCCSLPAILFAQSFVVRADKMNIAYVGIENTLTVVSGSCGCDALVVSADKGQVVKIDGCRYKYIPAGSGIAELTIAEKKGNTVSVIGKDKLRVKSIPDPQAMVGGRKSGLFALSHFKAQLGISVVWENVAIDMPFRIKGFTFKVIRKGAVIATLDVSGNLFEGDCKRIINELAGGDKVILEKIRGVTPDGIVRSLNDLAFTMK